MEITYELSLEDYWHYVIYYRENKMTMRPFFRRMFFAVMLIVLIGGIGVALEVWSRSGHILWSVVALLPAIAVYCYRWRPRTKKQALKLATQTPGLLCEHTVAISPEWFSERTSVNESKISWKALQAIEEDVDFAYFFLSKANAYFIPKRAFSSLSEAQAFLTRSRRYWDAAKSGTVVATDDEAVWPPPPRSVT